MKNLLFTTYLLGHHTTDILRGELQRNDWASFQDVMMMTILWGKPNAPWHLIGAQRAGYCCQKTVIRVIQSMIFPIGNPISTE